MITVLLIGIPLAGALGVLLSSKGQARILAAAATLLTSLIGLIAALGFEHWLDGGFGLVVQVGWMDTVGVTMNMHADAVSLLLVLLTVLLMPLCVIGSWTAITHRIKEYYTWLLVLQAALTGVFLARDLIFFYICFEFTLVPLYFLIAIHGGAARARAATKFFIYTFTGSMLTLAGLLYVAWRASIGGEWTFDIPTLTAFASLNLSSHEQGWVLLALLAGFGVKIPIFPLHTWLPLAHTEAPTAASVILASVLLKLGTYGLYRFLLPMLPEAVVAWAPTLAVLAIIGILYAALICWVQEDVKKLIAYSSVSHLGFCVLGILALNPLGIQGSVLYMINHGLSTGALFFLVGMLYERYHTREMSRFGGLSQRMPIWSFFMVFFVLCSVGLPGLNGFVSEFLCLLATFTAHPDAADYPGVLGPWFAASAGIGMIIAAMYLLRMVGIMVFGPPREPVVEDHEHTLPADLNAREVGILIPLAVLCIVIGLQPSLVTRSLERPAEEILRLYPATVRHIIDQDRAEGHALLLASPGRSGND